MIMPMSRSLIITWPSHFLLFWVSSSSYIYKLGRLLATTFSFFYFISFSDERGLISLFFTIQFWLLGYSWALGENKFVAFMYKSLRTILNQENTSTFALWAFHTVLLSFVFLCSKKTLPALLFFSFFFSEFIFFPFLCCQVINQHSKNFSFP